MPQSLSNVIVHIVFSTKDRHPFLTDPDVRRSMHAYLATACRSCDCEAYRVGGTSDHVHLAARLARTITISKLVETIKTDASKWVKTQGGPYPSFHWQRGYGAFSISRGHLDALIGYIANQEEHHRKETFQEEYRRLLRKSELEFDERYVWD